MERTDLTAQVKVVVGPEKKSFFVHKGLISRYSAFFKAATSGRWTENDDKAIELPEDDPEIFATYLIYIYEARIRLQNKPGSSKRWTELADLYILADKLRDLGAANLVIDKMMRYSDARSTTPPLELVAKVFDSTADGNPLRRLFVDYYLHECFDGNMSAEQLQDMPQAFFISFFLEYGKYQNAAEGPCIGDLLVSEIREGCHYHQHDETHPAEEHCLIVGDAGCKGP